MTNTIVIMPAWCGWKLYDHWSAPLAPLTQCRESLSSMLVSLNLLALTIHAAAELADEA